MERRFSHPISANSKTSCDSITEGQGHAIRVGAPLDQSGSAKNVVVTQTGCMAIASASAI
ncbi:hypothetical protein ACIBG8_29125 [Nonomuraea sp. NPDC050556]|uniref:hypothetical protein n=1 Tax=Nonomuraea sp. NPDC050556 TaxID=3364369 RepID=UPI00379C33C1